jgi:hypothetical protein
MQHISLNGTSVTMSKGEKLPLLPKGVYEFTGSTSLEKLGEQLITPTTLYSNNEDLIKRFTLMHRESQLDLSAMIIGPRGSGKTVLAERICNVLGMPIILMRTATTENIEFIRFLPTKGLTLLFDGYNGGTTSALENLLDKGIPNGRLFSLFTTDIVNDDFITRSGRIRYLYRMKPLDLEVATSIVYSSNLTEEQQEDVVEHLLLIRNLNIDKLKTLIDECGALNALARDVIDYLNIGVSVW